LTVELSLWFRVSPTNYQVEYDAVIAGLGLAQDLGAREVQVKNGFSVGYLPSEGRHSSEGRPPLEIPGHGKEKGLQL
jgi:hypothetical protein